MSEQKNGLLVNLLKKAVGLPTSNSSCCSTAPVKSESCCSTETKSGQENCCK